MKSKTIKWFFLATHIFFILSNSVIASGITEKKPIFDINSKIFFDGKLISNPHIVTRSNQLASILVSNKNGTDSLSMKVIAKNAIIKDAIAINFDVTYKHEKEKMHFESKYILISNQEGILRISSNSNHLYEMRVIAAEK